MIDSDITGMKIADPNPFFRAMYEKDPALFLTESDGKFSGYSRLCAWNKRRQPVILTDKEKEKIDEEHPGSYEHAIKYGSSPDKKYWYICPRYWDLKRNVSLTNEQVKSGKYGSIIPQNAKTVPPGANIWEFTDPKDHIDKDGNYINHYPGFLKSDAHPNGLCVPCCFKTWDKPAQKKRREQCLKDDDKRDESKTSNKSNDDILSSKSTSKQQVDEYIKGPDKFPLQQGRFGYLPFVIQTFIGTDNKQCQINATSNNLKKDFPCYLRSGIENSKNKSFIGAISDIYSVYNNDKTMTIDNFLKNIIIPNLTLDVFVELQNGSLITEFLIANDIDIEKYKDQKIYERLKENNIERLKKIVGSYENFINYLNSSDSNISYEYLWDFLCMKNSKVFPSGLNIIILDLPLDDITSNINIICPTNFYSNNKYDDNKNTIILIKKYEYFEPVYIVIDKGKTTGTSYRTTKMYDPKLMNSIPNLKKIKETVKNIYNSMCKPLPSVLNIAEKYNFKTIKFKRNNGVKNVIDILKKYNLPILSLVLNYDNKVIGILTEINSNSGVIPCFPSEILDYPLIMLDDDKINLKNFEDSIQFLSDIKNKTKNEILCEPVVKILENKLIVGLLTETNQFVELIEPEPDRDSTIVNSIDEENFFEIDKKTITTNDVDNERIEFVKKIHIETNLFNDFRNRLKYLLSQYNNKVSRDKIENLSNSNYVLYIKQLTDLRVLIKELMQEHVEFIDNKNIDIFEKNKSTNEVLLIPKINLINNLDNENLYYNKISDELIRYKRIKMFMFEPNIFLSFSNIRYDLNDDEIILLQSLLTQEYFEDLIPKEENKYISFNSYDNVEPNTSVPYTNEYNEDDDPKSINNNANMNKILGNEDNQIVLSKIKCNYEIKKIYSSLLLKFRTGYKEIVFLPENENCTFEIIKVVINNYIPEKEISENEIKNILIKKYKELYENYKANVIEIFTYYGKVGDDQNLMYGKISIDDLIMNNSYVLNTFDIIILSDYFKIPITLISAKTFKENNKDILTLNINNKNSYIIRVPQFNKYRPTFPKYKLIINKSKEGKIDLSDIPNDTLRNTIMTQKTTLNDYIKNFKNEDNPPVKSSIKKGKKLKLIED